METNKVIAFSFTEGRIVRDLFYNNFFNILINNNYMIKIFSPAARVDSFVKKWGKPKQKILTLKPFLWKDKSATLLRWRNRILNYMPFLLTMWLFIEKLLADPPDPKIINELINDKPKLVVITNPMEHHEYPLYRAAQYLGIPTLGVVRSWDNLYRGFRIRPDHLAVWNSINKNEAIEIQRFNPDKVHIIGATQFDPYFQDEGKISKDSFAKLLNFNPKKPLITLALLGPFQHQYDETYLLDWLIGAIESGQIPKESQIVCRLHPWSRLEQFLKYQKYDFIRLSWMTEFIPSLGWTMTKEDVYFVGNLLRHSDVVISPGSTITIETAIFDTPTLLPIFHTYQPELGKIQFNNHLSTHFKRLKDLDLVPIIETPDDLAKAINHCLLDRSWYREARKHLVDDYMHFTDGKSTDRLAELIIKLGQEARY